MVTTNVPHCDRCKRGNVVSFRIEPEEAYALVVLNCWREICPSCFDQEAERAGVNYTFVHVVSSDRPPPRNPYRRKR